jgi:hypothetical protein
MNQIVAFDEAVLDFQKFLQSENHPNDVVWAFRQDWYSVSPSRHWVMWPLPAENEEYARALFQTGRDCGLVEMLAEFSVGAQSVATVIAPFPDEIQGWSRGLKLAIHEPLVPATAVGSRIAWRFHTCGPAYRRFQRYRTAVPERPTSLTEPVQPTRQRAPRG